MGWGYLQGSQLSDRLLSSANPTATKLLQWVRLVIKLVGHEASVLEQVLPASLRDCECPAPLVLGWQFLRLRSTCAACIYFGPTKVVYNPIRVREHHDSSNHQNRLTTRYHYPRQTRLSTPCRQRVSDATVEEDRLGVTPPCDYCAFRQALAISIASLEYRRADNRPK